MAEVGALRINLSLNSVDFSQGMQNINRRLTALNSEFRAITSGSARFDNSLEALRARSDVLTRTMTTHRTRVEELRRQYQQSAQATGQNSDETLRLATAYNRAVTAMNQTKDRLRDVNRRIQEQSSGFHQLQTQVNTSVDSISREMRVLETGFAAATAGIDNFGQSTAELQQREQHLNQTLNLHQQRVQELTRLHQESARVKGNDAAETQELEIRLNRATQQMRETQAQLDRTTNEIQQQSNAWNRLQQRMTQTGARLQSVGGQMQSVGSDISQSFGAAFLAVSAGLGLSAKRAMDFEQQMSSVYSVMAPDEVNQFGESLKQLSMKMGAETKYSALEAAQGIEELIKAGLSPAQVAAGGLEGALSLATAGELELADAAEIASTALNAFKDDNLSVMRAADLLAGAANASATSVGEMKYGLSMVSAVASGVGLSFEDTAASLAVFAQNGLKGSDAGTSLKTMLLRLSPTTKEASTAFSQLGLSAYNTAAGYKYLVEKGITPAGRSVADIEEGLRKLTEQEMGSKASKAELKKAYEDNLKASGLMSSAFYNEEGQIKSMAEIAELLKTKMAHLNDEQRQNYLNTMFGTDAIRAANILYKEGAKGISDMDAAMNKIKSADVAAQKLDNVKGLIQLLKGTIETAAISIGSALLPAIDKVVAVIQKMTDKFNSLSPSMQETIVNAALVAAGVTGVVTAIGVGLTVVGGAVTGFGALSTALGAATGAFTLLTGPVGLVVTGIGLATAAGIGLAAAFKDSTEVNLEYTDSLIDNHLALEQSVARYDELRDQIKLNNDEFGQYLDYQKKIQLETDPKKIEEYKNAMGELQKKSGLTVDELEEFVGLDADIRKNAPETAQKVTEYGNSFIDLSSDMEPVLSRQREFITNQLEIAKGEAYEKLKDLTGEFLDIQEKINESADRHNKLLLEQEAIRQKAKEIQDEINKAEEAGDTARVEHFKREQQMWAEKATNMDSQIERLKNGTKEEEKRLTNLYMEIVEQSKIYNQLVQQELKMVEINGKSEEALDLIDQKVKKLQEEKTALEQNHQKGKISTEEFEKQNSKITTQLEKLKEGRSRIDDIQTEQKEVTGEIQTQIEKSGSLNELLNEDHVKNIKIDDHGGAENLQKKSEESATKPIILDDYGKMKKFQEEARRTENKTVNTKFKAQNSIWDLLPKTLQVGIKFLGNIPGFATGTRNAPGGLSLVGEEGPELIHLPQGAKVIPNLDTEAILRKWNIPVIPTGGVSLTKGMAYMGEKGREFLDMRGSINSPLNSSPNNQPYSFTIQPAPIILDGVEIGKVDFDLIEDRLGSRTNHRMVINGVRRR